MNTRRKRCAIRQRCSGGGGGGSIWRLRQDTRAHGHCDPHTRDDRASRAAPARRTAGPRGAPVQTCPPVHARIARIRTVVPQTSAPRRVSRTVCFKRAVRPNCGVQDWNLCGPKWHFLLQEIGKIVNIVATVCRILRLKCTKEFLFPLVLHPGRRWWGSLQRSPDLVGFNAGLLLRGGRGEFCGVQKSLK